jgi:hypothetical protein
LKTEAPLAIFAVVMGLGMIDSAAISPETKKAFSGFLDDSKTDRYLINLYHEYADNLKLCITVIWENEIISYGSNPYVTENREIFIFGTDKFSSFEEDFFFVLTPKRNVLWKNFFDGIGYKF